MVNSINFDLVLFKNGLVIKLGDTSNYIIAHKIVMFSYLCTEYTVFTLHMKGSRYCWQILGKYSCITSIQLSFCEINILHAVVPLVSTSETKHQFGRKLAELSLKHITYCHEKEHITCIQEFSTDMHIIAKQKKNNRNVNVALQKHLSISAF